MGPWGFIISRPIQCMCMKVQKVFVVYDLKLSFYREQGLLMRYIHIKKKNYYTGRNNYT